MKPKQIPAISLPLITLILGVLGYVLFSNLNPVDKPFSPREVLKPSIDYIDLSRSDIRADQALLEDSAPLFLPTRWNASTSPEAGLGDDVIGISIHPPELHAVNSPFFGEGPKLDFGTQPPPVFSDGLAATFSTLGLARENSVVQSETSRGGVMVITRMGDNTVREFPLPNEVLSESKVGIWSPVEFFCTIENLTAMGSPSQTKFSGINELDQALSRFAKQKVYESGLSSGFYRITAYP